MATEKTEKDLTQEEIKEDIREEASVCQESKKDCKKSSKEQKKEGKNKEKIESLENEIKALNEKVAKEKDDYLRLMAEFDNYRRRTSQEKLELVGTASEETIKGLLPILDDFERAMNALKDSDDSQAAKDGTELIYNKLFSYLKTKGLSVIETAGKEFDTDLHEAVAQFPVQEEEKKGKIFDTVQTGYLLNGKVIRFAKVVVGI
ncbi:MAG: nucleotide exchange factor GrpE [Clostridium sp.]|nr:nucleotide exchange factor GrpE [Bacteroides sp.]MCM1199511.1 nucleotide exchange factor GrpE [Clostridium sp.]